MTAFACAVVAACVTAVVALAVDYNRIVGSTRFGPFRASKEGLSTYGLGCGPLAVGVSVHGSRAVSLAVAVGRLGVMLTVGLPLERPNLICNKDWRLRFGGGPFALSLLW